MTTAPRSSVADLAPGESATFRPFGGSNPLFVDTQTLLPGDEVTLTGANGRVPRIADGCSATVRQVSRNGLVIVYCHQQGVLYRISRTNIREVRRPQEGAAQ